MNELGEKLENYFERISGRVVGTIIAEHSETPVGRLVCWQSGILELHFLDSVYCQTAITLGDHIELIRAEKKQPIFEVSAAADEEPRCVGYMDLEGFDLTVELETIPDWCNALIAIGPSLLDRSDRPHQAGR